MTSTSIDSPGENWTLPERREGHPADAELQARRAQLVGLEAIQQFDSTARVEACTIASVRCLKVTPPCPEGTLLYFHGGGFRMGRPELCAGLASRIAARTNLRVVLPDYALAPEHPFPAALLDGAGVYDALQAEPRLLLGGDSAGGGLAASLVLAAHAAGRRRPDGLLLLSPWLDLANRTESFVSQAANDAMFSRQSADEAACAYLAGTGAEHQLASPWRGSMQHFPPAWICASANEVLRDDAVSFAKALADAGQRVDLTVLPSQDHVWPVLHPSGHATEHVLAAITLFVAGLSAAH
ncbi:MAG: alpha/beta hydrolase [Novosphingobium sp.]